jgi:hypothetical protein
MLTTPFESPLILNYSKDSRNADLIELWLARLIENFIPNPSKLQFEQEVLHDDL